MGLSSQVLAVFVALSTALMGWDCRLRYRFILVGDKTGAAIAVVCLSISLMGHVY
jgi:hypothetical protein